MGLTVAEFMTALKKDKIVFMILSIFDGFGKSLFWGLTHLVSVSDTYTDLFETHFICSCVTRVLK